MNKKSWGLLLAIIAILITPSSYASVNLYGPGGPHTALIDVAKKFEKQTGIKVNITFGPEAKWQAAARKNADILWGASLQSLGAIIHNFSNQYSVKNVQPLYLHDAIILVKKGNRKNIKSLDDLSKKGMRIVVINGAGHSNTSGTAVWEDIVGRKHDINFLKAFKKNIIAIKPNSGSGFKRFNQPDADAWITWRDWAISNPGRGQVVNLSPELVITRSFAIVLKNNNDNPDAKKFIRYLHSNEALKSFYSYGWYISR